MKRSFFCILFAILLVFCLSLNICTTNVKAITAVSEAPVYDPTFNNNAGALFANGTPITISEINGITTATWDGGSQEIPNTASIFGGGQAGTNFDTSSITINSGDIRTVYGGGASVDENNPAIVSYANIAMNGGNITNSIYGGGLLYSTVENTNITVNDGTAAFTTGGGQASAVIDGVPYSTGTEDAPQDSKTIVRDSTTTINDGNIDAVYGGGQGYSNTENTNIIVNDGNIEYVTAGGSNGYTGNANVRINGGNIDVYQSTNRGIVDSADVRMTNGTVTDFYVGGENAPDVTGTINSTDISLLGGKVTNLNPGTNNGEELSINTPDYNVIYSGNVVENNNIPSGATNIDNILLILMLAVIFIALVLFLLFVIFGV